METCYIKPVHIATFQVNLERIQLGSSHNTFKCKRTKEHYLRGKNLWWISLSLLSLYWRFLRSGSVVTFIVTWQTLSFRLFFVYLMEIANQIIDFVYSAQRLDGWLFTIHFSFWVRCKCIATVQWNFLGIQIMIA